MTETSETEIEGYIERYVLDTFQLTFDVIVVKAQLSEEEIEILGQRCGAFVLLFGDWTGSVAIYCSPVLLDDLTSRVYGIDRGNISDRERNDMLREMANLIGGNLNAVLSKQGTLSPPKTLSDIESDTDVPVPEGELLASSTFHCLGEPLIVNLYKRGSDIPRVA